MSVDLSIVIPLFNEEQRLPLLKAGISEMLACHDMPVRTIEWIFVDDGSADQTWIGIDTLARNLSAAQNHGPFEVTASAIQLPQNQGKGGALQTGVMVAQGKWILTMDADMATAPDTLQRWHREGHWDPKLTDRFLIGSREHTDSEVDNSKLRKFMGRRFNDISRVVFSALTVRDSQCGFKLYPAPIAHRLFSKLDCPGWAHDVELLMRAHTLDIEVQEKPVAWHAVDGSQIRPVRDGIAMFFELLTIRLRLKRELWGEGMRNPWHRGTIALMLIALLLIGWSYPFQGITIDEPVQQLYGQHCATWYSSGFQDDRAMHLNNLAWYGGAFEIWPGALKEMFPDLNIFPIRKLLSALLGLMGVLAAARLAVFITGQARAGFFVAAMLLLHPFFVGHLFINSKDAPFAVGYLWSLWYLARLVRNLPYASPSVIIKLGIVFGLTLGVRVGGVLLLPVIFLGVAWPLWNAVRSAALPVRTAVTRGIKTLIAIGAIAYAVMLVFWPAAQLRPIAQPLEALQAASKFPWNGNVRYYGEIMPAAELPSFYNPLVYILQTPEVILIGFAASLLSVVFVLRNLAPKRGFMLWLMVLAVLLPIGMVLAGDAILFDKARHFMFLIGPMAIVAAIGWTQWTRTKHWLRYVALAGFVGLATPAALALKNLYPYQYTYFNQIAGGPEQGYEDFGADYWFLAGWEALEQLDEHLAGSDGKAKVYCPGFQVQLYEFMRTPRNFKRATNPEHANFVVSPTRIDIDKGFEGKTILQVERYGYPLYKVIERSQ